MPPPVAPPPDRAVAVAAPPPRATAPHRSILASPWLWTVVGAVVVGGSSFALYYYVYDRSRDPTRGTLGAGTLGVP